MYGFVLAESWGGKQRREGKCKEESESGEERLDKKVRWSFAEEGVGGAKVTEDVEDNI